MRYPPNLTQYLIEQQSSHSELSSTLCALLEDIGDACREISEIVGQGALGDTFGSLDNKNVHGETQQKLDILANDLLLSSTEGGGYLAGMVSEEMTTVYTIPSHYPQGEYLLLFDPLDGSSNIEVNVSIGTIFSILKAPHTQQLGVQDFLQPGSQQIAAGYAIYGPQTMFVFSVGNGVHSFTLDREMNVWVLTKEHIQIPLDTQEFAINASNARHWQPPVKRYVDAMLAGTTGPLQKDFNMRWTASMVADVHRILHRGGIFMYPTDARTPDQPGKLRLMYEANPMAFLIEQAGGLATDGRQRILNIQPEQLHQRVAVFLGSKNEVERVTDDHS